MKRRLPIDAVRLRELAREHGTPLYVYDAETIGARMRELSSFDLVRYAQKANPNLAILALLRGAGAAVDAVSAGEIVRALRAGFAADEIAYTADVFDRATLELIASHPLRVNCGSIEMLAALARIRPAAEVTLRVNPGFGHGHGPRVSTGGESSKHGIWHADLARAIAAANELGMSVVGLHLHIGSGSDLEHLAQSAGTFESCARLLRSSLRSLSAGGGIPVPYRPGEEAFDIEEYTSSWLNSRERASEIVGRRLELEVEPGRFLVAQSGVLLTRVLGTKRNGSLDFALVDAGFNTLLRPAMYGAYHHIEVLGDSPRPARPIVVAGPLCESGDVFTQDGSGALEPRVLPELASGDLLAICDAGAYGMSMASRYNSQLLPAEVLVEDGVARVIRRRETYADLMRHELKLGDVSEA